MDAPVVETRSSAAALFTAPNLLTLSRPLFGGAVWLVRGQPLAMFGLMAAAGVTDVLDGWLARRRAHRLRLDPVQSPGVWLDPLCDKVFVVTVLGAIYSDVRPALPWLFAVVTREILLGPLVLAHRLVPLLHRRRYDFHAALIGKVTTVAQFLAASAFVFRLPFAPALALAAGVSGLAAVVHYSRRVPSGPLPAEGPAESRARRGRAASGGARIEP